MLSCNSWRLHLFFQSEKKTKQNYEEEDVYLYEVKSFYNQSFDS